MNTSATLHPASIALGWALLHFVWQGAAVAAALAVVRLATRRRSPGVRYATACAALALMAALPVATFFVVRSDEAAPVATSSIAAAPETSTTAMTATAADVAPLATSSWERARLEPALPWLVVAWLVGVAALSLRLAGALVVTRRLRRATTEVAAEWQRTCDELARRLGVRRAVRLCESALADVPSVVGWLRPVVLVPASVLTGLDAHQLEAILAHELAHVRRHDYLVNLAQSAVETLLFYHPAVWWVSGVVREEREHCCDDLAVATFGDVRGYARALADLEDLRVDGPALALAANGGSLVRRVERLLGRASAPRRAPRGAAGLVAAVLVAVTVAAAGASTRHGLAAANLVAPVEHVAPLAPLTPLAPAAPLAAPLVALAPIEVDVVAPAEPIAPTAQDDADAKRVDAGEFAAVGYPSLTEDQLRAFENQGVSPAFVRSLQEAGLTKLSPETLVAFRVQGVDADFAREMESLGLGRLSADELVAFRVQGVDASYVRELRDAGYGDLRSDDLVAGRVHGVSGDFVRKLAALGLGRLEWDQLVAFRVHGVSESFVRGVRDLGYTPSADQLVAMRVHGVSLDYVRANGAGGTVSIDDMIDMRVHGEN